jgi:prepilin-type N-terminal cleavage/methylation domain-containing protein
MKILRPKLLQARGFTLVEVILAVGIIAGLLVVVLFFYQQAARLRTELLVDAERSSSARLLMERLTAELRTARTHTFYEVPLVGDSTYLQFIAVDLPSQSAWTGDRLGRVSRPESDLKLVSYGAEVSLEDTNIVGLARSEEPLIELRTALPETAVVLPGAETNKSNSILITDAFRFIRFRYWDGHDWVESWSETYLPKGVEVTLGSEPMPADLETEEYPYEIFRRVIYLPGSAGNEDDMFFDLLFGPVETAGVKR